MDIKHTPLPWTIDGHGYILDATGLCVGSIGGKADGHFIITACNSHAALLEALEKLADDVEYGVEATPMRDSALINARAAIAKAKAEQS